MDNKFTSIDYSGSGISTLHEIQFGNPIGVMLMPQRTSTFGIGLAIVVYIFLIYSIRNKDNFRELIFAGFLIGILPIINTHSFIVVFLTSLLLGLIFRRNFKFFAYLFIPAIILSAPQMLAIQSQVGENFFGLSAGWLDVPNTNLYSNNNHPFNLLSNFLLIVHPLLTSG